jgi:protein-arginine kinase activator protein McsA
MKQKYCGTCKKDKDVDQFNKNKAKPDGLSTICRKCSNKHSKEYYKKHGEKMRKQIHNRNKERVKETRRKIYEYYLTHPCIDCGEDDPIVLEFDHVRGTKRENVSKLICDGLSWNVVENEIKKCEVRCANCHRRKTAKQLNYYIYTPS